MQADTVAEAVFIFKFALIEYMSQVKHCNPLEIRQSFTASISDKHVLTIY